MIRCALPAVVFDGVIDVSHHNGAIDWPGVAGAGIALAFIKATQGTGFVDPTFERNRSGAAKAGVLVVPYHFLDAVDPDDQAEHFLAVTGLEKEGLAMIDWESAATAADIVAFGRALVERTGRDPVAYYGFSQLPQALPDLSRWPLMLPEYPHASRPGHYATLVTRTPRLPPGRPGAWDGTRRPYDFHQYTPAGRIAGIATPVDRSIWVGTVADLRAWYAGGVAQPTAAASPSPPTPPGPSARSSSPSRPRAVFLLPKGRPMQTLAYLLARFSEPSSYAGLGAVLALLGWHLSDSLLGQLAQMFAAACGLMALALKERGLVPAIVLAVAVVPALSGCAGAPAAVLGGLGSAGSAYLALDKITEAATRHDSEACDAYAKARAAAVAAGRIPTALDSVGDAACKASNGDLRSIAIRSGEITGQLSLRTTIGK